MDDTASTVKIKLQRPKSLADAVKTSAQQGDHADLDALLREFLDEFYCEHDVATRQLMLAQEPPSTGSQKADAYIAAMAEHLSRWIRSPRPSWSDKPERFLRMPHFPSGMESLKATCIAQSPVAFRRRMIFVDADPLYRPRRDVQGYTVEPPRMRG